MPVKSYYSQKEPAADAVIWTCGSSWLRGYLDPLKKYLDLRPYRNRPCHVISACSGSSPMSRDRRHQQNSAHGFFAGCMLI